MAETMNLGPEWMKNSSGANQSSGPVPKTPTTPTVPNFMSFRKFALAEFRYGKEDILALYAENFTVSSNVLQSVSLITSEIVKPMAFLPYSEEEQLLFAGCVNSNNSLRLIGRGGGPRGGRGGRGRGRGRGGSDGGYYHRSFSFDEQTSGGNTDHFNRSPMDGSGNRGGYEYGRGRGGVGARLGWNNSWRDGSHNSEDERWNSGTNTRWPLASPSSHHPGRSDSGWRNRDESKKDSLLPEWAQQDNTDGKSTQKDSNGGSTAATEPTVKDKPPVVDKVDTKLSPTDDPIDDKNDNKNSSIKRPEEPESEVTTQPGGSDTTASPLSSLRTQEAVNCKVEDKPAKTFADNKKITPLSPVANNVRQPTRNEPAPVGRTNKTNGHHEELFSPDGFTQFEKQAEDLLLTEEEETPSSSPITLTGGSVTDTLLTSAVNNNTITFTNSHTRLHQQPQSNPMQQITPPVVKQVNRPTTLPTPTQPPAIEEFYTWYYQDPDGMIQGPFTSGEMKDWFDAGYFTMDLMVRRACDNHMLPLGQVIQMWKRIPFVTEGKQPPPVKVTESFWKPLIQRQPQRQQQQQQSQQQMSLQTHAATTTTSDLTSTAESIWGRGAAQEKAIPSTQWPNIESVWEQSQTSPQEDYARHEEEVRRLEQERQEQKKLEEQRRKEEAAQRRLEEEIRLKQQQEKEAKALKEAKERQEQERIRLLEEERKRKEEETEQERERQRQLEQDRLAEWKRNEEAKKFLQQQQQQQEAERRLREQQQQQVLLEAAHEQQRSNHQQSIQQQQQVWSVMGPQSANTSQPTGGASLLQIQQQQEARLKKQQQMIREQQIRAQLAAAQQAQAQAAAAAGWMTAKGMVASPTAGKSFLEIQMEQQKTAITNPPAAPKQSSTAWNNPAPSNHVPTKNTSSTGGVWQTQPAVQQRLPHTNELEDDFWDLCMKDIPAAHRPTSLPQSRGGQTKTATAKQKRMDKQEERIRNIFATPTANDELVDWCESQFATIQTELDAATFVNFLLQFESPHEVHDYVKLYIGDTPASKEFTRQFLERAKQCKQQKATNTTNTTSVSSSSMPQVTKSKLIQEEAYPLPGSTIPSKSSSKQENGATKPTTPTTPVGANGGSKKKKKGKMQKIDPASILGFSVNAAERPNAGEIQSVHDAH